ncbi:MAG: T9SS type A sorting domain-containing protein, partial [Chitinophagales bacterium]
GNDYARSMALQPDGKIVVAGYAEDISKSEFAIVRYNEDGTPDRSFGKNGIIASSVDGMNDYAQSAALQKDGKIVVAGYSKSDASISRFALARFNTDGALDLSFGQNGTMITPIGKFDDVANSLVIQPDGKIIAAGYSSNGADYDFALVRFSPESDVQKETASLPQKVTIFPNPSSDQVQVAIENLSGNIQIDVFNILGKKIISINQSASSNETISLNIADLPAGAYKLILENNNQIKTGSFVKQ